MSQKVFKFSTDRKVYEVMSLISLDILLQKLKVKLKRIVRLSCDPRIRKPNSLYKKEYEEWVSYYELIESVRIEKDSSYVKEELPQFQEIDKTDPSIHPFGEETKSTSVSPFGVKVEKFDAKVEELFKLSSLTHDDQMKSILNTRMSIHNQFNDLVHLRNIIKSLNSMKDIPSFEVLSLFQDRKKKLIEDLVSIDAL